MERFPLLWNGRTVGELTAEGGGQSTWFDARCTLPGAGLWCAWAVGETGELRLGVVEPRESRAGLRRQFSQRMTLPLGRLVRGELRPAASSAPAAEKPEHWQSVSQPETLFRAPWLRRQLRGVTGALTRTGGERRFLALPWDNQRPFPLTRLFCLARVRKIGTQAYAVFAFDREDQPVFW